MIRFAWIVAKLNIIDSLIKFFQNTQWIHLFSNHFIKMNFVDFWKVSKTTVWILKFIDETFFIIFLINRRNSIFEMIKSMNFCYILIFLNARVMKYNQLISINTKINTKFIVLFEFFWLHDSIH